MIVIKIMERDMIVTTTARVTSGSVNLPVKFHFKGDEWDDLVKTAVFIGSGQERDVALITDECAVPADVLAEAGGDLKIGVYGRLANGATVIPTIWGRVQYIYEGTEMSDPSPHDPEPDWTAQVQQAAATALTKATAVEEAAARGDFDGVSPEVTISSATHGHSVTITDRDHPEGQSFDVLDGATAYEQAVAGGYEGTEAQFNAELAAFKDLSEQAASSATAAASSATAAAGSATAAAGSATDAAGSATQAASSETAAAGSASNAASSATSASGSATAASSSATAAAGSASDAATAKTAAEAAQTAAAASAAAASDRAAASATAAGNAQTAAEAAQTAAVAAKTATESARDTAISTLQTEGAAQKTAIQQKGAEVIASIPSDYTDLTEDVSDLKSAFDSVAEYIESINLYNKNSPLNKDNYRILATQDGTLSGSSVSHPIPIELGKTYSFKMTTGFYGVSVNRVVRFCDAEGNLVTQAESGKSISKNATPSQDNAYATFTVTENIDYPYCCVNVRMSQKSTMIFAEGETLPEYSEWEENRLKIRENALPTPLPLPANAQNNVLYGKKAAFTGDSICYGAGSMGGYAKIIGENNSMIVSNIAVSGGTICSGTGKFCISESVNNMPADYDYYIVEGGVNDAAKVHGETLGTITSGYNSTLDTATVCGALESLCKNLQLNFKGKKYGFIFPHNVYGTSSDWNTSWRATMKQCLEKWGIPYLDLSDKCAQLNNLSALRIYTKDSDGWHPTEEGYRLFYVSKIEAWMRTL